MTSVYDFNLPLMETKVNGITTKDIYASHDQTGFVRCLINLISLMSLSGNIAISQRMTFCRTLTVARFNKKITTYWRTSAFPKQENNPTNIPYMDSPNLAVLIPTSLYQSVFEAYWICCLGKSSYWPAILNHPVTGFPDSGWIFKQHRRLL